MAWDKGQGYLIPSFDDQMRKYYDEVVKHEPDAGTFEQFRHGKYYRFFYAAVQADLGIATEIGLITEDARDFIGDTTEKIKENSLNPYRIYQRFIEETGFKVSLDQDSGDWAVAIDYTPNQKDNDKIAKLLATEVFTYGSNMVGDIEQSYQEGPETPAFVMKWTQGTQTPINFKVVITKIAGAGGAEWTTETVRSEFVKLFNERYKWGNVIQPQRIMNECDVPFAASVQIEASKDGTTWSPAPLKLAYKEIATAVLDPTNIQITQV